MSDSSTRILNTIVTAATVNQRVGNCASFQREEGSIPLDSPRWQKGFLTYRGWTMYAPVASQQDIMLVLRLITGLGLRCRTQDAVNGFIKAPATHPRMLYKPYKGSA